MAEGGEQGAGSLNLQHATCNRAERIEIARWAILAKEPACRGASNTFKIREFRRKRKN